MEGCKQEDFPAKIHLYVNRQCLGFENVDDVLPEQTIDIENGKELEEQDIVLRPLKFNRVWTLTLYVEKSYGGRVSAIGGLRLVASPIV